CDDLLFFFSSRRRHTRLQGDWSSDVCSSDLVMLLVGYTTFAQVAGLQKAVDQQRGPIIQSIRAASRSVGDAAGSSNGFQRSVDRSEERRVGKEGGARWAPEQ